MHLFTVFLLVCLPTALLAVKCTDPPTGNKNSTGTTTDVTDTVTDVVTDQPTAFPTTEAETTTPVPIRESWPQGKFSLLMAGNTCPEFSDFKKGYFYQDTEDFRNANDWPRDTAMIGPFKQDGYHFRFCTETDSKGDYLWEAGNYCIYKFSKKCPKGFQTGNITWDDENNYNQNTRKGRVPFGKYGRDTTVNFCCRDDGSASAQISLPIARPFYMLRYTEECQKVRYMSVNEEVFKFDDEDSGETKNSRFGAAPMDSGDAANHILHFCLYRPM
ncbi:hypothetical protein EGW08_019454 [Elysia chlorotica]|uniref:Apextrin C-terminal domain-containing protein n=1 Tax=Elysia chlorotica TaxID=188477 RepID=A0A433SU86_ELYCH|nr:hypothetical protein EGW08_019454 [Elysia chlorotica]